MRYRVRMVTTNAEVGYLTKDAARTYTSLSPRLLDYAVAQGRLRAFRVGKRVLFSREDLDEFVRQRVHPGTVHTSHTEEEHPCT